MKDHRAIEEQSLRLHSAVADKLRQDAGVLVKARQRVETWCADGSVHPKYAQAWHKLLKNSTEEICRCLTEPGESMTALRQCSPFAGVLTARERWDILRQAREARAL